MATRCGATMLRHRIRFSKLSSALGRLAPPMVLLFMATSVKFLLVLHQPMRLFNAVVAAEFEWHAVGSFKIFGGQLQLQFVQETLHLDDC